MPRYYVDVRSRFGVEEDLTGVDLPDLAAAHYEILKVAGELLKRWSGVLPEARKDIVIEILDETLRTVMMVPYLEIEGRAMVELQEKRP